MIHIMNLGLTLKGKKNIEFLDQVGFPIVETDSYFEECLSGLHLSTN